MAFSVIATDVAGNTASAQASIALVETPDAQPPEDVVVSAPASARAGERVSVSASATDAGGILRVEFALDGIVVGADSHAPYAIEHALPAALEPGEVLEWTARAVDFAGNATSSGPAPTEIVAAGEGMLVGEVYDDQTGEPLAAALAEARDAVEDVVAPFLIQQGFIQRTPRGRMLTAHDYGHLGLDAPRGLQDDLLSGHTVATNGSQTAPSDDDGSPGA